jgi:hypothetical protein
MASFAAQFLPHVPLLFTDAVFLCFGVAAFLQLVAVDGSNTVTWEPGNNRKLQVDWEKDLHKMQAQQICLPLPCCRSCFVAGSC